QIAREVRADGGPVVAAIVAAIDPVARPIQPPRGVRTDDVRRVPVRPIRRAAPAPAPSRLSPPPCPSPLSLPPPPSHPPRPCPHPLRSAPLPPRTPGRIVPRLAARRRRRLPWTDVLHVAGAQIEPRDIALLRLRVDDARIVGIAARLKTVAAAHDEPVA